MTDPRPDPPDDVATRLATLARLLGDERVSRRQIADGIRAVPGFEAWLVERYAPTPRDGEPSPEVARGAEGVLERHGVRVVAGLLERFLRSRLRRPGGAPPAA